MKLSSIIIAKNEAGNISGAIKCLSFSDETIVIDNGSSDSTGEIAIRLKTKVFILPGRDFSYLRNFGKEKALGDWILYMDADERVDAELAGEIIGKINHPGNFSGFKLIRQNYYLGKKWPYREHMLRLFKKDALVGWQGSLHETPIVSGEIGELNNPLYHYAHSSLSSMVSKTNEWSDTEALLRYKNNHPQMSSWRFLRVMFSALYTSYIRQGGWRAGTAGLIESIYQSFSMFITYAKLWEKQNNARTEKI